MSDHDEPPTDLFDAICRLDDVTEWLRDTGYSDEAARLEVLSMDLKGFILISVPTEEPS